MARTLRAIFETDALRAVAELRQVDSALAHVAGTARASIGETQRAVDQLSRLGGLASSVVAGAGFSLGLAEAVRFSDVWRESENRIKLVTTGLEETRKAQESVFAVAQATRSEFASTAGLYAAIGRNARDLGLSQQGLAQLTETINQSVKISGAGAESAGAALVQLGQGLASGVLRGEELNSIMEQTPRLAQAIAEGMGKTIGDLKRLGEAGELTAEKVLRALLSQADQVRQEFERTSATVGQSLVAVQNAALKFVGESATAAAGTTALSGALLALAGHFDTVATAALAAGGAYVGLRIAQTVGPQIPVLQAATLAQAGLTRAVMTGNAETLRSAAAASLASATRAAALREEAGARAAVAQQEARAAMLAGEDAAAKERQTVATLRLAQVQVEYAGATQAATEATARAGVAQAQYLAWEERSAAAAVARSEAARKAVAEKLTEAEATRAVAAARFAEVEATAVAARAQMSLAPALMQEIARAAAAKALAVAAVEAADAEMVEAAAAVQAAQGAALLTAAETELAAATLRRTAAVEAATVAAAIEANALIALSVAAGGAVQATRAETAAQATLTAAQEQAVVTSGILTAKTTALASAQARLAASSGLLAAAGGLVRGAWSGLLAMLGGPWGAALLVGGGALMYLALRQGTAEAAAEAYTEAQRAAAAVNQEGKASADALADSYTRMSDAQKDAATLQLKEAIDKQAAAIAKLRQEAAQEIRLSAVFAIRSDDSAGAVWRYTFEGMKVAQEQLDALKAAYDEFYRAAGDPQAVERLRSALKTVGLAAGEAGKPLVALAEKVSVPTSRIDEAAKTIERLKAQAVLVRDPLNAAARAIVDFGQAGATMRLTGAMVETGLKRVGDAVGLVMHKGQLLTKDEKQLAEMAAEVERAQAALRGELGLTAQELARLAPWTAEMGDLWQKAQEKLDPLTGALARLRQEAAGAALASGADRDWLKLLQDQADKAGTTLEGLRRRLGAAGLDRLWEGWQKKGVASLRGLTAETEIAALAAARQAAAVGQGSAAQVSAERIVRLASEAQKAFGTDMARTILVTGRLPAPTDEATRAVHRLGAALQAVEAAPWRGTVATTVRQLGTGIATTIEHLNGVLDAERRVVEAVVGELNTAHQGATATLLRELERRVAGVDESEARQQASLARSQDGEAARAAATAALLRESEVAKIAATERWSQQALAQVGAYYDRVIGYARRAGRETGELERQGADEKRAVWARLESSYRTSIDRLIGEERRHVDAARQGAAERERWNAGYADRARGLVQGLMSGEDAYADRQAEIGQKQAAAQQALAQGRYDQARRLAEESIALAERNAQAVRDGDREIVSQADAVQASLAAMAGSRMIYNQASEAGERADRAAARSAAETARQLQGRLDAVRQAATDLDARMAGLRVQSVEINTSAAEAALGRLSGLVDALGLARRLQSQLDAAASAVAAWQADPKNTSLRLTADAELESVRIGLAGLAASVQTEQARYAADPVRVPVVLSGVAEALAALRQAVAPDKLAELIPSGLAANLGAIGARLREGVGALAETQRQAATAAEAAARAAADTGVQTRAAAEGTTAVTAGWQATAPAVAAARDAVEGLAAATRAAGDAAAAATPKFEAMAAAARAAEAAARAAASGGGGDHPRYAAGGYIRGPGGPTEDRVLIWASDKEFMQPASSTAYYGVDLMEALRRQRIPREALAAAAAAPADTRTAAIRRYAAGGIVRAGGRGTPILDALPRYAGGGLIDIGAVLPRRPDPTAPAPASAGRELDLVRVRIDLGEQRISGTGTRDLVQGLVQGLSALSRGDRLRGGI